MPEFRVQVHASPDHGHLSASVLRRESGLEPPGALRLCTRTGSVQGHCFRSPGGLDGACSSCPPVSDGYSDTEGCSRLGAPLIHQTVPRPAPACPRNSPRICTSTSDRP